MVKLTPELVQQCAQYINPVRDRELDLRGYKIPAIENLGATLDQFDCIDLSDNDVRKLDGFPLMKRLQCILLNNNRVCRIGENLEASLPGLETLILTNNHITELGDIDNLSTVKTLRYLSLLKNPVCTKRHYRLYIIQRLPQVRVLDFQKVQQKERETAAKLFKGRKGKKLEKEIGKRSKTFVPGAVVSTSVGTANEKSGPSQAEIEAIKNAIKKASTLEEVERLKQVLKSGQIPGRDGKLANSGCIEKSNEENKQLEQHEEMDVDDTQTDNDEF